jgi:transposase
MIGTGERIGCFVSLVAKEGTVMLRDQSPYPPTSFDLQVFEAFVARDHPLRKALELIRWDDFHDTLAAYYSLDEGQPAKPPVLLLKLEYLRYHYNLSDRQVIERAKTDIAFRYFLQVDRYDQLVDPSLLCYFRGRLGRRGFRKVFRQLVHMAREHGLVKDRLRIKDASHVIANIAVPSTLALVARIRDELLAAAEPFDPVRVEGERVNSELLRESTAGQNNEQRLVARVTHLREILAWIDSLQPPSDADDHPAWQTLLKQQQLAHQILADQEHPEAGHRTLSTVDPEARRGKHGGWYEGYVMDVMVDADSELITELNVLSAGGDEAVDAIALVRQEEEAQGNDIEALSIDGAGFHGPMLRELEDPEGLAVNTFVPPKQQASTNLFTPNDFVEDPQCDGVKCPAGETSDYRQRDSRGRGWVYRFKRTTCQECPLLSRCMSHAPRGPFGRTVRKSDYEAEYHRARQKATTPEYEAVRAEHPLIERKLGEMLNRHGGRRARYWGLEKVLIQELMVGLATNVKRMVRLLCARTAACECAY